MKKLTTILFLFLLENTYATIYYVSNAGNDANNGDASGTSWRTLNKVNSASFRAGDSILFKRGDTFYGSLRVRAFGTYGFLITFGAYGSGANPVITGFTNVTSWTNLGGNIWESRDAVSSLPTCNMVVVNGKNTPMGRYPNSGYLNYQSHSGSISSVSSSLNGSPDWTGASIVIKKRRYVFETGLITGQSGGTISYTDAGLYTPKDGFGFFIQNDPRTLDVQNEWYYSPSTKKIRIYSIPMPTDVKVTTVNNLLTISGQYITIDGLDFEGANGNAIILGSNTFIQNCNISFAGINAIKGTSSSNTIINNNNISNCNDNGITTDGGSSHVTITNNTLNIIGIHPGMTQTYSYGSISSRGANSLIQYNNIDSSGYNGIEFSGANSLVINNFINYSCLIKDDGGGIYSGGADLNRVIKNNIVLNTIGSIDGTNSKDNMGFGIYLDSYSSNFTVQGNTVAGCSGPGGVFSNLDSNVIRDNTFFNNVLAAGFLSKSQAMFQHICCKDVRMNIFNNNILFTKNTGRYGFFIYTTTDDVNQFASADSNYYVSPSGGDLFRVQLNSTPTNYSFSDWKIYSGWDSHSQSITESARLLNSVRFEYNATSSGKTIQLDAKYIDVKGKEYNGSITLAPYTSAILIKDGH